VQTTAIYDLLVSCSNRGRIEANILPWNKDWNTVKAKRPYKRKDEVT
jgi:hypothetical protein